MSSSVKDIAAKALEAFWGAVTKSRPEITTGDLSVETRLELEAVAEKTIVTWLAKNAADNNVTPTPTLQRASESVQRQIKALCEADPYNLSETGFLLKLIGSISHNGTAATAEFYGVETGLLDEITASFNLRPNVPRSSKSPTP